MHCLVKFVTAVLYHFCTVSTPATFLQQHISITSGSSRYIAHNLSLPWIRNSIQSRSWSNSFTLTVMSMNFIQICLCKCGGWEHLTCPMQTKGRYKITPLSNKPSNQICSCSFQSKHWAGSKEHLSEVQTTGKSKNLMEISSSWQLPI